MRLLVAVRVSYYLTLHIVSVSLRQRVLDHVSAEYAQYVMDRGDLEPDFDAFFEVYREHVEGALDLTMIRAGEHITEYRRVWTDHATMLGEREFRSRHRRSRVKA
ncbi:hypothetical protein KZZ52_51575 [Dactylosporangium sp. AC04546]|uniref:hypothetical protein n=1 Tax=Dactylosporangium sp. AC04546 TaxID=2862460 RepID=UPI001EDD2765|nr:hypothetical protein [Dactylosporangium sp. AC04546]WVK82302.1 hypothetical protein KZZ52_51575 [Dactylosporangium sp. AC04546]